ncbi:MAG: flagellar basal body P-ring formation chaperone FlgA [Phycisphaerales bacterium JB064]
MRSLLTILVSLVLATVALGQETASIALRSTVLAAPGQSLTLGDIAELRGDEAERLSAASIDLDAFRADPSGWRKIDAQSVRVALEEKAPLWGAIQFRGGPCYVRVVGHDPVAPLPTQAQPEPALNTPTTPGTVRQLAEHHIARAFKVPASDIEVRWVSATDGLLDHPTAGALPHIDDAGRSDRMALRVTLYDEQANIVIEGEAKAEVRIRRDVAVLTRDVPRRRIIAESDIRTERQWIDATTRLADPTTLVGREAAMNLKAGTPVGESDVHTAIAIKRGDRVQVRIITPSVTAKLWARALKDGRPGETIEFESIAPSRSDRLRFDARVESAGSAVAVAGAMTR